MISGPQTSRLWIAKHQGALQGQVFDASNQQPLIGAAVYWEGQSQQGTTTDLPVYNFEGVRARFYGIESTAKVRMVGGQDAVLSNNAGHGTMDLELRGDVVHAQDVTHNKPLPRIAPMRLGADVVWLPGDSGDNGEVANATVDRLLAEDVDAFIGAASAGVSLTVIDKITAAGGSTATL